MQKLAFLLLNPLIASELKLIASDCIVLLPLYCNHFLLAHQVRNTIFCLVLACFRVLENPWKWVEKSSLSDVRRSHIVALHKKGYSERLIRERVRCSKNAVHNAVVKFQITGIYSDAKRFGRLRKTTPSDDHVIRRTAVWSLMSSASKIRSILLAKGANVSQRTVSRRLVDDYGLKVYKRINMWFVVQIRILRGGLKLLATTVSCYQK